MSPAPSLHTKIHYKVAENNTVCAKIYSTETRASRERYEHCLRRCGAHFEHLHYAYRGKSTS
jgi:hypothetical protein